VIDSFRVGLLVKPEIPEHMAPDIDYALVKLANERNVPVVELVKDGWIDVGDGVRIFVLNPGADSSKEAHMCHTQTDLNALSLVMRMEFYGIYLTLDGRCRRMAAGCAFGFRRRPGGKCVESAPSWRKRCS